MKTKPEKLTAKKTTAKGGAAAGRGAEPKSFAPHRRKAKRPSPGQSSKKFPDMLNRAGIRTADYVKNVREGFKYICVCGRTFSCEQHMFMHQDGNCPDYAHYEGIVERLAEVKSRPLTNYEECGEVHTREDYLAFFEATTKKMLETTKQKNSDYSPGVDPFANFKNVEVFGICSAEQGFLARMTDKLSRIAAFVKKGDLEVKSESAEDTLLDLATYSVLMMAYLRSKPVRPA